MLAMNLLFTDEANPLETAQWSVIAGVAVGLLLQLLRYVHAAGEGWMRDSIWH
jgi:hypothetical protein